jgi:hypothetical protein
MFSSRLPKWAATWRTTYPGDFFGQNILISTNVIHEAFAQR